MLEGTTQLILITGFLGSGKTTLLHESLGNPDEPKTALILNEQGQLKGTSGSFDASCNLSMGSPFLKIVEGLLTYQYDYILAETSGLAQPSVLNRLMHDAEQRSCGRLRFRGMICVIDTLRFLKLFSTVVSLYEQAAYADCFVLTKTDLAEPEDVENIRNLLKMIHPTAPVFLREQTTACLFKTVVPAMTGTSIKPSSARFLKKMRKRLMPRPLVPKVLGRPETVSKEMSQNGFKLRNRIQIKKQPWVNGETLESGFTFNAHALSPQTFNALSLQTSALAWRRPSIPDHEFIHEWTTVAGLKSAFTGNNLK